MVGEYEVIGFSHAEKLGLGVERLKDFQACCVQRGCAPAFRRFADGDREGTVSSIDVLSPHITDLHRAHPNEEAENAGDVCP